MGTRNLLVKIRFNNNVHFLKTNSGKKGAGMPVVRNPQFNFKEGFCWTDINSTFLKARLKDKGVFDVVSMTLFTRTQLPDWYYVILINTYFMSLYVDTFINNTSHFQINDARQVPIIIPNDHQLAEFRSLFSMAVQYKREAKQNSRLSSVEAQIDTLVNELYGV